MISNMHNNICCNVWISAYDCLIQICLLRKFDDYQALWLEMWFPTCTLRWDNRLSFDLYYIVVGKNRNEDLGLRLCCANMEGT